MHADGLTSYQQGWERSYKHAICELGECILYRIPSRRLPKGDLALPKGVWLGLDVDNGKSFVGTTAKLSGDYSLTSDTTNTYWRRLLVRHAHRRLEQDLICAGSWICEPILCRWLPVPFHEVGRRLKSPCYTSCTFMSFISLFMFSLINSWS